MTTEIIQVRGTREQRIAYAKRIRDELEECLPEMAQLRRELIAAGMAADNFSSVASVVTPNIDYKCWRDDPKHFERLANKPPIITEEIRNAVQARTSQPVEPVNVVFDSRGGRRRR